MCPCQPAIVMSIEVGIRDKSATTQCETIPWAVPVHEKPAIRSKRNSRDLRLTGYVAFCFFFSAASTSLRLPERKPCRSSVT